MKLVIAKILIAGSILFGFGIIACDSHKRNNEGNEAATSGDNTNVDDNNYNTGTGMTDSASVNRTDTTYNSTSDTVYKRR